MIRRYAGWSKDNLQLRKHRSNHRGGYIYVFRGKGENPFLVKIGRAKDPYQRMLAHRTANPLGVKLIAVFPVKDDVKAEAKIHKLFEDERISNNNEWFRYSIRIMWWVANLSHIYAPLRKELNARLEL